MTPDMMLEILSRSFVLPVSGYYFDVEEAVFWALMDKTKEVVDLVRPQPNSMTMNIEGIPLANPALNEDVTAKRRELEDWMKQIYEGAKKERARSRLRYEKRALRWKKMWDEIVRDGKNTEEVLKVTKSNVITACTLN